MQSERRLGSRNIEWFGRTECDWHMSIENYFCSSNYILGVLFLFSSDGCVNKIKKKKRKKTVIDSESVKPQVMFPGFGMALLSL